MELYYINSLGNRLDFTHWPYQLIVWNPQDYEWEYSSLGAQNYGGIITAFSRGVQEKEITIAVHSMSKENRAFDVNYLFETVETDVVRKTPGRLFLNGQYLQCYFIANEKTVNDTLHNTMNVKFTMVSEYPFWCNDVLFQYKANPT